MNGSGLQSTSWALAPGRCDTLSGIGPSLGAPAAASPVAVRGTNHGAATVTQSAETDRLRPRSIEMWQRFTE